MVYLSRPTIVFTRQACQGVIKKADIQASSQSLRREPTGDFTIQFKSPVEMALEGPSMTAGKVFPNEAGVGKHWQHISVDY